MQWGSNGTGSGEFRGPESVAVDGSGNVYVSDRTNNVVQKFDSDGSFLVSWGSFGSGDGYFHEPKGIAADDSGDVYVADYMNRRIQKFDGG